VTITGNGRRDEDPSVADIRRKFVANVPTPSYSSPELRDFDRRFHSSMERPIPSFRCANKNTRSAGAIETVDPTRGDAGQVPSIGTARARIRIEIEATRWVTVLNRQMTKDFQSWDRRRSKRRSGKGRISYARTKRSGNTRCRAFTADNARVVIPKLAGGDLALPADSASFRMGDKR